MPGFIKQTFIVLVLVLLGITGSLNTKYVSMNNHPCMVRPTLVDLDSNKPHYYSYIISLDRCDESCTTVEESFGRTSVSIKKM